MTKWDYSNKELKSKKTKTEEKILKKFSFPNQGIVLEAESYEQAVKKMQALLWKDK